MLTMVTGKGTRTCEGIRRRDFLRVGALGGWGGLTLAQLLAARHAAAGTSDFVRDRAVVLVYLSGGASHIETFDPKMTAPDGTRSVTGEVQTRLPGVTFGGTFPLLAQQAHRMAIVRSFHHDVGAHEQAHVHVLSGGTDPLGNQRAGFSMGSAFARLRGANHPRSGLPTYALLTEQEVDGQYLKEVARVAAGSWPGPLGPTFAPFRHELGWRTAAMAAAGDPAAARPGKPPAAQTDNPLAASMRLNLPREVLDDRLQLLRRVDQLRREVDASQTMAAIDEFSRQAVGLILGGAFQALDFRREDPKLIERYDTFQIAIGHKSFRPSTLGRQLLVARRLCEAGCGFVTVHSAGWDMHADGNNPGMLDGMQMLGRSLDKGLSAFLEDVEQRGLSDKILLVLTGDFGRTPQVNKSGGRDHWSRLSTLAFAGGGLRMGQVIGQSARGADVPNRDPVTPAELLGTVMQALFDVGKLRLIAGLPRELMQRIDGVQPIADLF